MKTQIAIITLTVFAAVSCVKEVRTVEQYNPESPMTKPVIFRAEGALDNNMSVISGKNASRMFVPSYEYGKGCFYGTVTEDSSYCFIQPYSSSYLLSGDKVGISVPYIQKPLDGGFDTDAYILAGQSAGYSASLVPFSRLVSFGLDVDSDIESITLRSESGDILAGDRTIDFSSIMPVAGKFDANKKCKLIMNDVQNGSYSFVLPALELAEGVNMELVRSSDDRTATLTFLPKNESGVTETLDLGTIHTSDLSWQKLIPMRFVESVKSDELEWPFNENADPAPYAEFTTTRGGYEIKVNNFKGLVADGMKGFVFGEAVGDTVALPAMPGLALNKVTLVVGADGSAGEPCIRNARGKVVGDAWTGQKTAGDSHTWTFLGEHNIPNNIELTSAPGAGGCAIRSLILSYRVAAEQEYIVYSVETKSASDIDPKTGTAVLNAAYSASIDNPAKYQAGFQYRVKGTEDWTDVAVENPAQSAFSYELTGIETEHFYEFRAFVKGETDLDTTYGSIQEFEISNSITLNLEFGDGTTSKTLYYQWNSLWGLKTGNSGVQGPVDKTYTKDGVDYTFTLYADHNVAYRSASSKYYGYCFDYSTTSSDPSYYGWMRLPGVKDMKLTNIEIKLNTKGQFNLSSSVNSSNVGDKVYTGGVNINQTSTTQTHTLTLDGTSSGERVYICSETRNVTIMYLILKYKPAK